jgi:general secretion pathway protein A
MYKNFFGLKDSPFNANPDPRYLFLTKEVEEALSGLTYGIEARKGFVILSGEVGTGKTTLLNRLLEGLHERRVRTAFLFNSRMNSSQLLDCVLAEFEIPCDSQSKSLQLIKLNQWLLERYAGGETVVLIIDEAQNLSTPVLEEIRLLSNMETASDKLLQIVLSGQTELEVKLKRPELRQLRQRITLRCKTAHLTQEQTQAYIAERLRIAGWNGDPIFSTESVKAIHAFSSGIPRLVNLLCEHALINGYAESQRLVTAAMVQEIAREFELDERVAVSPPATAHLGADVSGSALRKPARGHLGL